MESDTWDDGCARCKARVVDLPCSCHICGLTLISSPHLARSYHHLFPVKAFTEVPQAELDDLQVTDSHTYMITGLRDTEHNCVRYVYVV